MFRRDLLLRDPASRREPARPDARSASPPGGRLLEETYGIARDGRVGERAIEVQQRGGVYPGDEFVYWGFGAGGLIALAGLAGFAEARIEATPTIDGHPRVLGALVRPGA